MELRSSDWKIKGAVPAFWSRAPAGVPQTSPPAALTPPPFSQDRIVFWRTFYCLKIIIEASKNIQPNTCPNSSPLLPGGEHRAFPFHLAAHTTSQDPALGRPPASPPAHRVLSHRLERGPGVRWGGWLSTPFTPTSTSAGCELCVGKGASSLDRGPPTGERERASPHSPHPSPAPQLKGSCHHHPLPSP